MFFTDTSLISPSFVADSHYSLSHRIKALVLTDVNSWTWSRRKIYVSTMLYSFSIKHYWSLDI